MSRSKPLIRFPSLLLPFGEISTVRVRIHGPFHGDVPFYGHIGHEYQRFMAVGEHPRLPVDGFPVPFPNPSRTFVHV